VTERVLCDAMLGKLARYLRMCGYDTAYALDRGIEADAAIGELARREGRTLLTRDADLAARTTEDVPDPAETGVWRCVACETCFWMGSHWDDVGERLP
jgi:uncharacterized protein with PIN domain